MVKISVMQFSDMHTASLFPSAKTFVSSILSDIDRQKKEVPPISKPNILIVCGDLIEGEKNKSNIEQASKTIRNQYIKSKTVLQSLCEKIFCGNTNNIIVVPGNHDVSWCHSCKSMEKIKKRKGLNKLLKNPNSNYRWDWSNHSYYKISDFEIYNRRFELFSEFYSEVYHDERTYSLNPDEQFDIFEYPEEKTLVVGFNSCFQNDHLNHIGSINADCIANCYEKINQSKFEEYLKIAVWHHDVQGYPGRSDFMDYRTLQVLIDKGFQIGLHGHNHKFDIFETKFSSDQSMRMNVFGCGSLGAQRQNIPLGESRQYAVIELDTMDTRVRFNLRKALNQPPELPIWLPGNIIQNKDKSYIDVSITRLGRIARMTDSSRSIQEAEVLITRKDYKLALEKLSLLDIKNPFVRRLTIECYWQLDDDKRLIATIDRPTSIIEFSYLSEALWREKDIQNLKKVIEALQPDEKYSSTPIFERVKKKLDDAEHAED